MNAAEAHILLDAAKAGAMVQSVTIKEALRATGDLMKYRPHGVAPQFSPGRPPKTSSRISIEASA